MGFWLYKTFQSQKSFDGDSGTEVFDLPKRGIISNIMLESYALSGTQKVSIMSQDIFSKIEIIGNGSTVIQSLTGTQVQASQAHDDGRLSQDKEMVPSGGCYGYFDIRFGRFVGDPKYALDCGRWDAVELKVTYDLAAGGTKGTTGYTTATGKLKAYGLYSPEGDGVSPVGYLKKELKKTHTTTAGGTEDLALPTDFPYRRILLCHKTNYYPMNDPFQYVTLDINNGARKPLDNLSGADLMQFERMLEKQVMYHQVVEMYLSGADYLFPRLGFVISGAYFSEDTTLVGGDIGVGNVHVHAGGAGTGYVHAYGFHPDRTLSIDLEKWSGGKDGVEAMMDCLGYDQSADIHLQHTQQHADSTSHIVLEQYASK